MPIKIETNKLVRGAGTRHFDPDIRARRVALVTEDEDRFRESSRFSCGEGVRKLTMDPSPKGQVVRESIIYLDDMLEPKELQVKSILLKDGNDVTVILDDLSSRREYKFTHVPSAIEKTE
jgi:hypothetical protein